MDYPKSTPNVGLVGGKFVDENVGTGTPGSLIPATWGNSVTDELLAVIKAGGIVPSEGDLTQLLKAIQAIAASDIKRSVRVATIGPIALSGLQTIDAVALKAGDRVLAKDQANASQNWIYTVAAGAWVRALDANESAECTPGHLVIVEAGTAHGGSLWQLSNTTLPTLGTTALTFARVFGKTGVAAGDYNKVTVDPQGRVTGGTNPTTAAGYGLTDVYTKAEVYTRVESDAAMAATGWGPLGPAASVMPAGTDLNNMIIPGTFGQTANNRATLALNYPEALAGTLLVLAAGPNLITQTYRVRGPTNKVYERNLYAGTWSAWTDGAQLDSPTFRGEPKGPTAPVGTNNTQLANTAHVRLTFNQYGLGSNNTGVVPATAEELPSLQSGNYYYPSAISPYPSQMFVQRMVYATNRGFEIGNIPYQKRIFGRASSNDGTWMAPFELANLDSPALIGTPTVPTPAKGNSSKLAANTEFVQVAIAVLDTAKANKGTTLAEYGIADALVAKANYVSQQQPTLAAPTAGLTAADTALVIREAKEVGAAQSTDEHAPGIGFFWAARRSGRLIMDAAGLLKWNGVSLLTGAVASQSEVDAGSSDANVVTPAKLRFGFTFIKGGGSDSNAIKFPSWLGSLMIQWGVHVANTVDSETTVTFPLAFSIVPGLASTFTHDGVMTQSGVTSQGRGLTANGFQSRREDIANGTSFSGTAYIRWIAIGY